MFSRPSLWNLTSHSYTSRFLRLASSRFTRAICQRFIRRPRNVPPEKVGFHFGSFARQYTHIHTRVQARTHTHTQRADRAARGRSKNRVVNPGRVINDFRLQEVRMRPRAHADARHESCIRAAAIEATDMQATRQEALQDRVAAPRNHVHPAPAESAGAAIQLCSAQRAWASIRILYGTPAAGSCPGLILRDDATSAGQMGIAGLLSIRLPRAAFRHPVVHADPGAADGTAEATDRPGRSAVSLRGASLNSLYLARNGPPSREKARTSRRPKRLLSNVRAKKNPHRLGSFSFFSRRGYLEFENSRLGLGPAAIPRTIECQISYKSR